MAPDDLTPCDLHFIHFPVHFKWHTKKIGIIVPHFRNPTKWRVWFNFITSSMLELLQTSFSMANQPMVVPRHCFSDPMRFTHSVLSEESVKSFTVLLSMELSRERSTASWNVDIFQTEKCDLMRLFSRHINIKWKFKCFLFLYSTPERTCPVSDVIIYWLFQWGIWQQIDQSGAKRLDRGRDNSLRMVFWLRKRTKAPNCSYPRLTLGREAKVFDGSVEL